jgi:hypothetical protein
LPNVFGYWLPFLRFGLDAQQVVALRLARLARDDVSGREARLMVSEKIAAFGEAQTAMMLALTTGASPEAAMRAGFRPYRRRVRANRKRLAG